MYGPIDAYFYDSGALKWENLSVLKRILTPLFNRIARSLGINDVQLRLDALEAQQQLSMVSDETYAAIEERFRGSPELIKERQRQYLPFVKEVVTASSPLLDIGCGRGEWLTLLKENKIPARGIDSNAMFVQQAHEQHLDVTENDVLPFLINSRDSSFGAITMFQVAEHLPLNILEQVLSHLFRSLVPGGVTIIEIPNLETLRVGAGTFWIDPTHVRPLYPDFLVFLVERAGFTSIRTVASTPLDSSVTELGDDQTSQIVQSLWNRVNGPGDFAVIARR